MTRTILGAALLLASACATTGPRLPKFQLLAPSVRISGTVVAVEGTDFDLLVDNDLATPWPVFAGVVHCEVYGHDGLPEEPGEVLTVGQRVAVSGALVLDNDVHQVEEAAHPERAPYRGLYRAWLPKPELHPYWGSTIVVEPAPLELVSLLLGFYGETYSTSWKWNQVAGVDGHAVAGSWTTATVRISPAAAR